MSVTLWLALLVQFVTVALLRLGLGKAWLRRPATALVLASVVYDGLAQVLLAFPSVGAWDTFRDGIAPAYEDDAALLLSVGMLAFAAGFLLTGRGSAAAAFRRGCGIVCEDPGLAAAGVRVRSAGGAHVRGPRLQR